MSKSVLGDKSFNFAVRIVELYKYLTQFKKEYVLSKQLLRYGTSVGANVREALNAQSRADFIHKMYIVQKEVAESIYWIELLHCTNFLDSQAFDSLHRDAKEIEKITRSKVLTAKSRQ